MSERTENAKDFLRANGVGLVGALLLVALGAGAVRLISRHREVPPARKTQQFTMVKLVPERAPAKPPPEPPRHAPEPQRVEEPRATRVELKSEDLVAPQTAPSPPGGGRLSLAAEATGPGDSFNLAGNPGGRGLLSGGGLGDGSGDETGDGLGGGGPAARFGWYYAKVAAEVESAFRRVKHLSTSAARLELRIWVDPSGRITRVAPVRADLDASLQEALQSVVGVRLNEPPPADIPMPMVARLTARRPQ